MFFHAGLREFCGGGDGIRAMKAVAEQLQGRRGDFVLFSGLSFSLAPGDALLLTGPNGSGKSTLMRILAGLLPADRGTFTLVLDDGGRHSVSEAVHYLGHRNAMKRELTVTENLAFWKKFQAGERTEGLGPADAIAAVGLEGIAHLPFGYLSAGQQRRIALARLLLNRRPVWLLDEPTAALDKASDALFSDLVEMHLKSGGIAIAATHLPLGLGGARTLALDGLKAFAADDSA